MNTANLYKMVLLSGVVAAVSTCGLQAQTPGQSSSPSQLVAALQSAFGEHHARAVHAKGIILEGKFTPDAQSSSLPRAFHLQKLQGTVIIRYSAFTGIP